MSNNKKFNRDGTKRKKIKVQFKTHRGQYIPFPRVLLKEEWLSTMSVKAKALLVDLIIQYNGYNNGDLSITWKIMKQKGWTSEGSLDTAKKELLDNNVILVTRQGSKNKCSLYALTFYWIDEDKNKKYDAGIKATDYPPGNWIRNSNVFNLPTAV